MSDGTEQPEARRMVAFATALCGNNCISHATLDGVRTLCGRTGWMAEDPWSDIGPDCLTCSRALAREDVEVVP